MEDFVDLLLEFYNDPLTGTHYYLTFGGFLTWLADSKKVKD